MLKKAFVWLSRIRYRCGYGVHSPFAFDLITNVFYEKTPYYAYADLLKQEEKLNKYREPSLKVKRLLFRLVNRFQPFTIIDVGELSNAALYLQAAKKDIQYISHDVSNYPPPIPGETRDFRVDFMHLRWLENDDSLEEIYEYYADFIHKGTVCVIEDIHRVKHMKEFWQRLKEREEVGVTFDLYDVGILFFDKTKIKQHYIVNF